MTKRGGWPESGFAEKLQAVRVGKGFGQSLLAELAGCHAFTISKLERGEQEPAWPLVIALARALRGLHSVYRAIAATAGSGAVEAEGLAVVVDVRPCHRVHRTLTSVEVLRLLEGAVAVAQQHDDRVIVS